MDELGAIIRTLIEKDGPVPIAGYMELALQHPEFGYYRHGDPIGRGGDFITAPEVSQMFGEMIGLFCADVWRAMEKPGRFTLLELGPGRGTLMQDALRATRKVAGFHTAMDLSLLENNATFRKMQTEKLLDYLPHHIENLNEIPPEPVIVIANEFFDALPVRQFEKTADGWCERLVGVNDGKLVFVFSKPDPSFLLFIPHAMHAAPVGTVHESSIGALTMMRQLAQHIAAYGGAAIIIDYGYAAPPGKGTLQAVAGHKSADILENPGRVDLTAHVDFVALKQIALSQDAKVSGPVGQGEFLQALGIEMRAMQLKHTATPQQIEGIDSALQRLIDPSEMGSLFKAMAVTSASLDSLSEF